MPIENQYLHYYEQIGLPITQEDLLMSDDQDKIVYISLDHDMVYLNHDDNENSFPIKIKGHEWSLLWWMYRLSERKCMFKEYLSEYIVPVCRRYFIDERKRLKDKNDDDDDRGS